MPEILLPPSIESLLQHKAKLTALARAAIADADILGMTIKGSFALDIADELSDLDLSFVVQDDSFEAAVQRRPQLAQAPANPVASFTAEHVGLPELLVVLYDDLVHADFRYVRVSEFPDLDEDLPCFVVWQRGTALDERLPTARVLRPHVDLAWLEARMWTWVWYTQTKILRGEVYEALDALQFLRSRVLFPLLAVMRGRRPGGSRRAEQLLDDLSEDFAATVASPARASAMEALHKTVDLYVRLADPLFQQQGIKKADEARGVALRALRAGLDFKP